MIAIVDYGTGNLRSLQNALHRLGCEAVLTASPEALRSADRVLLPGVGEARSSMERLKELRLTEVIPSLTGPVLGICLGMQLMCAGSEEGDTPCLGIFDNRVVRLEPGPGVKIPHMGWNTVHDLRSPLYAGVEEGAYVYYVHSFGAEVNGHTIAVTDHGRPFSGSLGRDNFYGCQFHPEKSGAVGERILENFLSLG